MEGKEGEEIMGWDWDTMTELWGEHIVHTTNWCKTADIGCIQTRHTYFVKPFWMFFLRSYPVSLLQVTTVLLAPILQIHGAQQGTWGWPPARVSLEAMSCRGEKLGVAFCLEQKASSLPGWRRDESTALSSGGMAICPAQLELWASIPSPRYAAGRNNGSAESAWLGSEGLRSLSNSLRFICVSMQHTPLVLCRVKPWPAPLSADMHLAGNHLCTALQPFSTVAKMGGWMSSDSSDPPVRTSTVKNLLSQGKEAFWQGDLAAEQGFIPWGKSSVD